MNFLKKYWSHVIVIFLIVANIFVFVLIYNKKSTNLLDVYFFDVGQGDSILINSPTDGRVLIDGGPNSKVLSELGKVLPFGDRKIDVLIETHPDKDHIGGLGEVVSRYDVGLFIEPGVESSSEIDNALRAKLKAKNIRTIIARRGLTIDLGSGVKLFILFPNQDVSNWETNDASIVAKLVYGNESFLLTGDSTKKAEYLLIGLNESILKSNVLKVGHHGSRTSTSLPYVELVKPNYAIISAGKDNSYGHPHLETLDTLNKIGSKILSTINLGTIQFETSGQDLILK